MKYRIAVLFVGATLLINGQERDLQLDSGGLGAIQVRPMTATRAPIKPMGGTTMIVNSPSPVDIAILNPSN